MSKREQTIISSFLTKLPLFQLVVLALVAIMAISSIKFFKREVGWRTVRVQVVAKTWENSGNNFDGFRAPYWLSSRIKKGSLEKGITGGTIAEVIDLEKYQRTTSDEDMYLTLKIYGDHDGQKNTYVFKGRPVVAGQEIDLQLDNTNVVGQVVDDDVQPDEWQLKSYEVKILITSIPRWKANRLQVGDTINGGPTRTIAKINSIERYSPLFTSSYPNENVVDVLLTLELNAYQVGDQIIFGAHQAIRPGLPLWLFFNSVSIFPGETANVEIVSVLPSTQ